MRKTLYQLGETRPAVLDDRLYDSEHNAYTAPFADEDLAHLGYRKFGEFDPELQHVVQTGSGWAIEPIPAPVATEADVDRERDRRINGGMTFQGMLFQTDAVDRERIDRSRISALAALQANAQPGDLQWHGLPVNFFWIAADNTRVPMDAPTMVGFGNAVAAMEGLLVVAASDLKTRIRAGTQIMNVGDDSLWPAV